MQLKVDTCTRTSTGSGNIKSCSCLCHLRCGVLVCPAGRSIYWVHGSNREALHCNNCSYLLPSESYIATEATQVLFVKGAWPAIALTAAKVSIVADQVRYMLANNRANSIRPTESVLGGRSEKQRR